MMRLPCANAIHMASPLDLVAPLPSRPRPHWSYERQAHCVSEKVPTCDRLRLPGAKPRVQPTSDWEWQRSCQNAGFNHTRISNQVLVSEKIRSSTVLIGPSKAKSDQVGKISGDLEADNCSGGLWLWLEKLGCVKANILVDENFVINLSCHSCNRNNRTASQQIAAVLNLLRRRVCAYAASACPERCCGDPTLVDSQWNIPKPYTPKPTSCSDMLAPGWEKCRHHFAAKRADGCPPPHGGQWAHSKLQLSRAPTTKWRTTAKTCAPSMACVAFSSAPSDSSDLLPSEGARRYQFLDWSLARMVEPWEPTASEHTGDPPSSSSCLGRSSSTNLLIVMWKWQRVQMCARSKRERMACSASPASVSGSEIFVGLQALEKLLWRKLTRNMSNENGIRNPCRIFPMWYRVVLPCLDSSSTLQLIATLGLEPSKFITCHNQGTELRLASALVYSGSKTSRNKQWVHYRHYLCGNGVIHQQHPTWHNMCLVAVTSQHLAHSLGAGNCTASNSKIQEKHLTQFGNHNVGGTVCYWQSGLKTLVIAAVLSGDLPYRMGLWAVIVTEWEHPSTVAHGECTWEFHGKICQKRKTRSLGNIS